METDFRCRAQRISGLTCEMKREPSCAGEHQRIGRCSSQQCPAGPLYTAAAEQTSVRKWCRSPELCPARCGLIFARDPRHDRGVLEMIVLVGRALALAFQGHQEVVLENIALRQQLRAVTRPTMRPHLQPRDRLFWIVLARIWPNWRTALVLVQPDTVVRWHRDWLRRRWTRRSKPRPDGRPPIDRQIRALVREMATANPLWGAPRMHGELRILGVDVSERTVSRLLERLPRPLVIFPLYGTRGAVSSGNVDHLLSGPGRR